MDISTTEKIRRNKEAPILNDAEIGLDSKNHDYRRAERIKNMVNLILCIGLGAIAVLVLTIVGFMLYKALKSGDQAALLKILSHIGVFVSGILIQELKKNLQ